MNKKEIIKKWLEDNQNKKVWIKQLCYNVSIDVVMEKGYRFSEEIKDHYQLTDRRNQNVTDIMLFNTEDDKIDIGNNENNFSLVALDFNADFEIGLKHSILLFILL